MALTKNFTTDQGVNCPNAYILVSNLNYIKFPLSFDPSKPSPNVNATASIFYNKTTREEKLKELVSFNFYFQVETPENLLTQAYEELKKLPNMDGAIDC